MAMNVLIGYATYSSGTATAAEVVAKVVKAKGNSVTVKAIKQVVPDELHAYDLIIFGSPSWENNGKEGQPHEDFLDFIQTMQGKTLTGKKFAIFGLGDSSYMNFCGATDCLAQFVHDLDGTLAGELCRIDGYFFDQDTNNAKLTSWSHIIAQA